MSTHSALMGSRIGVMTQFAEGFSGGLSSLTGFMMARAERARVYRELSNLTDRDLDDIGITRDDVARVAGYGV
jgi:uncharacterized protein YjiS (DUF1127 family)